ncbi:hypothetical protein JCM8547_005800 [Rhodosporidiobolus lusitaniae]
MIATRDNLLAEIAELEAELARRSTSPSNNNSRSGSTSARKRERVEGASWEVGRARADRLTSGFVGDNGVLFGTDNATSTQNAKERERAGQLYQDNIELTGIEITSDSTELLGDEPTYLLRLHTLTGHVSGASISFTARLYVREPALTDGAVEKSKRDPGRDYVLERMECEAKGGGEELREALSALRLEKEPNPPAFFALLRQYSLLSASRQALFGSLRSTLPDRTASGKKAARQLTFSGSSVGPILVLSYHLQSSTGPTAIRHARPLTPVLSLTAQLPPSLSSSARAVFDQIPIQFERMLEDGFEPVKAVEAVVRAVFGEGEN